MRFPLPIEWVSGTSTVVLRKTGYSMNRIALYLGVHLLLIVFSPSLAQGQTCFEGKPECASFWITEVGYTPRMNDAPRPFKDDFYLHWELGHMININASWAMGGAVFFGVDDTGSRWALKGRVRHWLGPRLSVDLAPGILVMIDERNETKTPGFTGHVGLNFREWFQFVGMVEVIDIQPDRQFPDVEPGIDTAWYVGAKTGGYGGFIGSAVLIAAVVVSLGSAY